MVSSHLNFIMLMEVCMTDPYCLHYIRQLLIAAHQWFAETRSHIIQVFLRNILISLRALPPTINQQRESDIQRRKNSDPGSSITLLNTRFSMLHCASSTVAICIIWASWRHLTADNSNADCIPVMGWPPNVMIGDTLGRWYNQRYKMFCIRGK
jgi:hypothetical protein